MKIKIHVCDICGRNIFEPFRFAAIIKPATPMKIKVKRYNNCFGDDMFPWDRVEVCTYCAENIIEYCKEHCKQTNGGN